MLRDLHLLDGLTEGGTVTGTVLADDSDLLGALGLEKGQFRNFDTWPSSAHLGSSFHKKHLEICHSCSQWIFNNHLCNRTSTKLFPTKVNFVNFSKKIDKIILPFSIFDGKGSCFLFTVERK